MAFAENLDSFFDTQTGFAVDAIIKTGAGVTVRTVPVIFTKPIQEASLFEQQVEVGVPFIQLQTTYLAGVDHSYKFVIDSVTYRIVKRHDDGTGTSIVWLKQ
jgi:hypothetical protein